MCIGKILTSIFYPCDIITGEDIVITKKIKQDQPLILTSFHHLNGQPGLILTEASEDMATEFYKKYLAVMERSPTKLETLNLDFFINLFRQKDYNRREELLEISAGGETTTHQHSNDISIRTKSGSKCKLLNLVVAGKNREFCGRGLSRRHVDLYARWQRRGKGRIRFLFQPRLRDNIGRHPKRL
jgi:hypothetical protein